MKISDSTIQTVGKLFIGHNKIGIMALETVADLALDNDLMDNLLTDNVLMDNDLMDSVLADNLTESVPAAADQWLEDLERLRVTDKNTIEMDISILDSVSAASVKEIQDPIPDFHLVAVDEKEVDKFNLEHIESFVKLRQNPPEGVSDFFERCQKSVNDVMAGMDEASTERFLLVTFMAGLAPKIRTGVLDRVSSSLASLDIIVEVANEVFAEEDAGTRSRQESSGGSSQPDNSGDQSEEDVPIGQQLPPRPAR